MNRHRILAGTIPFVLLAGGLAADTHNTNASSSQDSQQVSMLLSDVKTQAVILSTDADTMEGYTRIGASWQSHAEVINQMRDHINKAGRQLTKLKEMRKTAAPWQAAAIDRIQAPLQELANNTEKAIQFINQDPDRLFQKQYQDYLEANADVSARLSAMIGDYVDYGRTKQRLETLAAKLELPAKP